MNSTIENNKFLNQKREKIIFPKINPAAVGNLYSCGIASFQSLTIQQLNDLIDNHLIDLNEAQNSGPAVKYFRGFGEKHSGVDIKFIGYIVSHKRDDCRVSIEGCTINCETTGLLDSKVIDCIRDFSNRFDDADEFTVGLDGKDTNKIQFRAWYD